MFQKYTQTTYETCLACCLLQAVGNISRKLEMDCINHSMRFSKEDFVIGHLDFIARKFRVDISRIVDNMQFYDYVKKTRTSSRIRTHAAKIDTKLVRKLLEKKPIIYIDSYYLFRRYHYPHFVTVLAASGSRYRIFDTWEGKERLIEGRALAKSISSLRNHIKLCPQIMLVG